MSLASIHQTPYISSVHRFHHVQAGKSIRLINSTILVRSHLARVPQAAAGLSPGGGCSQSVTAQDHEKVLLWPDWRWSTTFGNETTDFKAQSFFFCRLSSHPLLKKKRGTNLLCNLKGDLVGGTRAAMASLLGGESAIIRGCCCLKTSTLLPARDI